MALGRLMAKKHTIKVGGTTIEIDDLMDRMVEQVREGAGGEIVEAMEQFQAELQAEAEKSWPVGRDRKALAGEPSTSGGRREHSVNLFERSTTIGSNGVEVSLGNTAPWSWAVRFGRKGGSGGLGVKKGKKAWTQLITRPGRKNARGVADSMQERLVELAERSAQGNKK